MRDETPSKDREWTPEDIVSVLDGQAGTAVTVKLAGAGVSEPLVAYMHGELRTRADMPDEIDRMRAHLAADASERLYEFDPLALYHVGGAWLVVPRAADPIQIHDYGVCYLASDSPLFSAEVQVEWWPTPKELHERLERERAAD